VRHCRANDLELTCYKDVGLVGVVFTETIHKDLNGTMAIGHVRYSTCGGSRRENAQPLTLTYVKGSLAVPHNGNLVNIDRIKREYEYKGAIFHTTTDSEVIAYIIAQERLRCVSIEEAVNRTIGHLLGAYSLVVMSSRKLIAARDPLGLPPPVHGKARQGRRLRLRELRSRQRRRSV
jgi:amidophosphoribosyltransferase